MYYNGQKWVNFKSHVQGVKWQNQTEQRAFSHLFNGTTKISTSIMKSWSEVTPLIVWRVILYTVWFCMATVFIWSISGPLFYGSNLYVIGKENVLSLLSVIFVLCNRVQSSKITSYFELFWKKCFQFGWQNVATYFSTFFKTDWQIFCIFTEY